MALLHARPSIGSHPSRARGFVAVLALGGAILWILSMNCHDGSSLSWRRSLSWLVPAADLCPEQGAWATLNAQLGMPPPSVLGRGCNTLAYVNQAHAAVDAGVCTPLSRREVEAVRQLIAATPTNRTFREAWGLQVSASGGVADGPVTTRARTPRDRQVDRSSRRKDVLEWSYLITPDFQVRSELTARMVEMEGCDHVIEVGGYLTPLERYLLSGGGVSRLTNIEPGYNRAPLSNVLLPGGRCVRALSLPFTLSEYLAAAEVAKGAVGRSSTVAVAAPLLYGGPGGYSSDEAVCVVALGYSVPHRDGDADYALVSDAQLVVLEASISSVHNEVALNLTVALLTQPPGAATHELVTDTRLHLRDPHAAEHRHGDNSRRRLVTMRRVRRRGEQAAAYRAAAAAATGGRRYTPALSSWEGSNGQALCATVTDFRCTGNATTGLKQPRDVSGGALCARHFYRIPGVHTFAPPFARLLPLEEFGVCSQCGQDGVIAAIFNHIGVVAPWPQRGYYVEFGARIPNLLNSAYLRKHCGWSGLLLDGAPGATEHSPCHQLNACEGMEHVKQAFITAANVNELFARHGVPARFDLLTIDVDHQDYWILKALLEAARFVPSLVVVEFNPNFANTQAVTVPRNDSAVWDGSRHYGASLAAFARLAAAHGYCYVYNLAFTHALFVRCELLHPLDRRLELPPETEARGVTLHKPDPHNRSWQEVPSP